MSDKKTEKTKQKMSAKNKIILVLIGVSVLAFGGYHLDILLEANKYNTTYTHMKKIRGYDEMTQDAFKREQEVERKF